MSRPNAADRIRVMVVDDSPVVRELLVHLLGTDPRIEIVAIARSGLEAIEAVGRCRPMVITMDYHMPTMNGLDATRRIMETHPVPIVIVSGSSARGEVSSAFRLFEAGALAIVDKPRGFNHPAHVAAAQQLLQTVRLMSEVKVLRRWPARKLPAMPARPPPRAQATDGIKLVAIGASTGGPVVLNALLSALPKSFPAPIVIVQHIATGFTEGLAEWLERSSGIPTHVLRGGETLQPGSAYLAPDHRHIRLLRDGRIALGEDPPHLGHRPSISTFFSSVAAALGNEAIGVLLSGMGRDGADGLLQMKQRGATTIAQDRDSSVVHGMPGAAIELDAATHVLAPEDIAALLQSLTR